MSLAGVGAPGRARLGREGAEYDRLPDGGSAAQALQVVAPPGEVPGRRIVTAASMSLPPGLALDDRALLARSGSRATARPPRAGQPRRRSIGRSGRPGALLPGRGVPVAAAYHGQAARPHGPGRAGGAGAGRARPARGPRCPDAAGEAKAAGLVAAAERYEARFFAWHPQAEGIRAALRDIIAGSGPPRRARDGGGASGSMNRTPTISRLPMRITGSACRYLENARVVARPVPFDPCSSRRAHATEAAVERRPRAR